MQYRAGSDFRAPTRTTEQDFQFTVLPLPDTSSFVNGPFTAPIEVPENTHVVGDSNLFDIIPADSISFHSIQLSGADAELFTARNSIVNNAGAPTIIRISLAFKNPPNFESPQGGPDNNSNDYQVNITASGVGVNIIVRVTDEAEPPSGITLRAVRVTPTSITVSWEGFVNTGPPILESRVRFRIPSIPFSKSVNLDVNERTYRRDLLEPDTLYEVSLRVTNDEGVGMSNVLAVTTPPLLAPTFGDTTIPDQVYIAQRLRRPKTLPAATGGNGALTYTLTGPNGETVSEALPGLSFDPTTRVLGGKPQINAVTPATTYTYTAMDADDNTSAEDTATLEFSITVEADSHPRFTHQQPGMAFIINEFGRRTLPEAVGGNGALIYQLAGEIRLPTGLTYDGTVRPSTISGTPTRLFAKDAFTYAVGDTDIDDSERDIDQTRFNIAVVNSFPEFFETVPDQRLSENAPFNLALPDAADGTTPRTFTLTGLNGVPVSEAVPGMNFEPSLRFLHGRPTTVATTTLIYTVTDRNEATDTISFRVIVSPRVALDALDALNAPSDQTYTMDTEIPALTLPAGSSGTAPLTYTLRVGPYEHDDVDGTDNAVPGLIFDRTARTLTGTPTEATDGAVTLIYVARDINNGTAPLTFDITVAEAVMVEATDDQTYTMGTEIPDLTLPVATGGTGTLTYILTGPNGTDLSELPAGLLWTGGITNPGAITGTPTAITASPVTLTYTATDQNGSTDSATFTLTVAAQVAVTAPDDQTYTMGTMIPDLTLQAASGGTGTLTYNLTGPNGTDLSELPAGLLWTGDATNPGTITGEPTDDYRQPHHPDLYRHRRERQHRFGDLHPHRGSTGGGDRPGRPDLYDGHHGHRPDPAGSHRRYRRTDLHPDRTGW